MRKLLTTVAVGAAALGLAATSVAAAPPSKGETIVATAVALSTQDGEQGYDDVDGDFDVLLAAAGALGLDATLSGNRQLTVFAPTDGAFKALAGVDDEAEVVGALIALVGGDLDVLTSIVEYHVVPGRRSAASVVPADELPTLNGALLTKEAGTATLDAGAGRTANIVVVDVRASNGIIHAIDQVLLPS